MSSFEARESVDVGPDRDRGRPPVEKELSFPPSSPPRSSSPARGQEGHRLDRFKAVFMFNFVDYIDWPDAVGDSLFTFGVLGESPIALLLREVAERKSDGRRKLNVSVYGGIDEVGPCEMLFLSHAFAPRMEELIRVLGKKNILTIADTPGLGARGAAINFYVKRDKLRFEINRECLKRAGLYASSQLLKLATLVDSKEPGADK